MGPSGRFALVLFKVDAKLTLHPVESLLELGLRLDESLAVELDLHNLVNELSVLAVAASLGKGGDWLLDEHSGPLVEALTLRELLATRRHEPLSYCRLAWSDKLGHSKLAGER